MTATAPYAEDLLERYRQLPVANICDSQDRLGVAHGIYPVWRGARLLGPAFTLWTRSGDNLGVSAAIEAAQPGDVLVVNGEGDVTRALMGDMLGAWARRRGIAGFVIDGAARDIDDLESLGLPVFARGVNPAGPYKNGPYRLQQPVAIGTVVVEPGDLVVGDNDGVVIVRSADVIDVLPLAESLHAKESGNRTTHAHAAGV